MNPTQTESYLVSNVGTCLFLKLCGFVEECRAEIRDISENHMQLRVGPTWWEWLLGSRGESHPLGLEIQFIPATAADRSHPQAYVRIAVRDATLFANSPRFEVAARRVLWQLRGYLMVQ